MISAGASRNPSALGVHIRPTGDLIRGNRVADVLKMAEERFPGVGMALVPVFFPGSMRVNDEDYGFWRDVQERRSAPNQFGRRIDAWC